jgi:hypothetical protein
VARDDALFDTVAEVTLDPSLTGLAELMDDPSRVLPPPYATPSATGRRQCRTS